jgi:hypothetical protein
LRDKEPAGKGVEKTTKNIDKERDEKDKKRDGNMNKMMERKT